jgi:hypothetical protein
MYLGFTIAVRFPIAQMYLRIINHKLISYCTDVLKNHKHKLISYCADVLKNHKHKLISYCADVLKNHKL